MTTFSILLMVGVVLMIYHFVIEMIIAPGWRLRIQFRIAALRDSLVHIHLETPENCPRPAFIAYNNMMVATINNAKHVTFTNLFRAFVSMKSNPEKDIVEKEWSKAMDSISDPKFEYIRYKFVKRYSELMIANSAGWLIYAAIPILLFGICSMVKDGMQKSKEKFFTWVKQAISNEATQENCSEIVFSRNNRTILVPALHFSA